MPVANKIVRKVQTTPKSRKAPDTEAPKTAKASACSFVGDKVVATDPANGRKVARKVLTVFKHRDAVVDLKLSSGSVLTTTPDHPFWNESEGEFQRADSLAQSDELLTPKGAAVTAVGLQRSTVRWAEAYNLEIDDVHTYFVGEDEIFVHNQNTCATAAAEGREMVERAARDAADQGRDKLRAKFTPSQESAVARKYLESMYLGSVVHNDTARALEQTAPGRFSCNPSKGLTLLTVSGVGRWNSRHLAKSMHINRRLVTIRSTGLLCTRPTPFHLRS